MKTVTLFEFLTDAQIERCVAIYNNVGGDALLAKAEICRDVIEPNMAAINAKLGQENDASYLAYAVVYVLVEACR